MKSLMIIWTIALLTVVGSLLYITHEIIVMADQAKAIQSQVTEINNKVQAQPTAPQATTMDLKGSMPALQSAIIPNVVGANYLQGGN